MTQHVRVKYACVTPDCEPGIVIAPTADTVVEKGLAGPGLIAHVILSKYGDHLPLYRQSEIMAREGLDVTAVIWANRTYQILKGEFDNVGAGKPGRKANDMLEIGRPDLDWVALAKGMGVPASRATDCESLTREVQRGLAEAGPKLIEVVL